MVFRRKCGVISVILCLAPLLSFAEPHPLVSLHVQTPDEDSNWKRIDGDESDEVTIFLRERQGTKINEVLARGVVDAPPCHVFQVLRDSDRQAEFMPYLEARITKNASVDFEYVCEYLDLPWPISDRFVSLRIDAVQNYRENRCEYLVSWQKDETYACTVEEARIAYEDAAADPVVPPVCEGYWHLLPQDAGQKTLVSYYGFMDPGGRIPHWAQNMFSHSAIVKLFQAVRKRASISDLYPPCQCAPASTPDSPRAQEQDRGYLVDSSDWR